MRIVSHIAAGLCRGRARPVALNALVAAALFGPGFGMVVLGYRPVADMMWPSTGIGLACVILGGRGVVPGLFAGLAALQVWLGLPAGPALAFAAAETAELTLTGTLMVRIGGFRPGFERLRDLGAFVGIGVVIGPMLGAVFSSVVFCCCGGAPWSFFGASVQYAWLAHAPGALAFAPPMLCWSTWPKPGRPTAARGLELAIVAIGVIATGTVAWHDPWMLVHSSATLAFVPMAFCVWAALRFGPPGAALASGAAVMLAARGTTLSAAAQVGTNLHLSANFFLVFVAITTCTSMLAASIMAERNRAEHERRRLEARVQRAQKFESLGLLAGAVAHDFNNLLTPILGGVGLLEPELAPPSPGHDVLRTMESAARQARDLCRQMLAYAGRAGIERRVVDLAVVVVGMQRLLQNAVRGGAELAIEASPGVHAVAVDVTQMQQVLLNVVQNAADAMADRPGTIRVQIRGETCDQDVLSDTMIGRGLPPGPYVALAVGDDGSGMTPEHVATMFDPFFSTKGTGRGLGLAATLGVVRAHGGTVSVKSAVGQGTTVTVWLPAAARPPDCAPESTVPAAVPAVDATVLVVDDEPAVRLVVRRLLERAGFTVLEASSGERAIALCRDRTVAIDVVLLDLLMPGLDGHETFAELARIRHALPVILSTGFDHCGTREAATAGYAAFLDKPYDAATLVGKVRQILIQREPAPARTTIAGRPDGSPSPRC